MRFFWLMLLLAAPSALAQSDVPGRVANFAPRVARVKAIGNVASEGFGFVVGETDADLFLVTAAHVLSAAGPSPKIRVAFRGRAWTVAVAVRQNSTFDVAALRVPKGSTTALRGGCVHPRVGSYLNTSVWFVGREGTWYISTLPGRINAAEPDLEHRFSFDIVGVRPGSSGGPLLGNDGLLGMILEDTGLNEGRAVDINAIAAMFAKWKLPWASLNVASSSSEPPKAVLT
jgi:hypothetical protein